MIVTSVVRPILHWTKRVIHLTLNETRQSVLWTSNRNVAVLDIHLHQKRGFNIGNLFKQARYCITHLIGRWCPTGFDKLTHFNQLITRAPQLLQIRTSILDLVMICIHRWAKGWKKLAQGKRTTFKKLEPHQLTKPIITQWHSGIVTKQPLRKSECSKTMGAYVWYCNASPKT